MNAHEEVRPIHPHTIHSQLKQNNPELSFFLHFCKNWIILQLISTTTCCFREQCASIHFTTWNSSWSVLPFHANKLFNPVGNTLSVCIKQTHCNKKSSNVCFGGFIRVVSLEPCLQSVCRLHARQMLLNAFLTFSARPCEGGLYCWTLCFALPPAALKGYLLSG